MCTNPERRAQLPPPTHLACVLETATEEGALSRGDAVQTTAKGHLYASAPWNRVTGGATKVVGSLRGHETVGAAPVQRILAPADDQ